MLQVNDPVKSGQGMFEYASDETYSNDGTSGEKQKNTKGGSKGNPRVSDAHNFDSENHVDGPF